MGRIEGLEPPSTPRGVSATIGLVAGLATARAAVPFGLFVSTVAVGRVLHASELGRYAALTAVAQIVVWGCGAGFPIMTIRDVAAGRTSNRYLTHVLITFIAGTLPAVLAMGLIYELASHQLIQFEEAVLAGIAACLFNAMYIASAANSGRQDFTASATGEVVGGISLAILSVAAVALGGHVREVLIASCGAWCLATAVLIRLYEAPRNDLRPESYLDLARRQLPYLIFGVVYGSYSRLDVAILRVVVGATRTGIYAAAYRLLGPFYLVGSAFAYVFQGQAPTYDRPWTPQWVRTIRRSQVLFGLSMTVGSLVGVTLAPWFIALIFGPDYVESTLPAQLLLVAIIPYSLYWPLLHGLITADERRELLWLFAIPTVVDALLVIVLGRFSGPTGAALAWICSESLLLLIVEARFRALYDLRSVDNPAQRFLSPPR